ncbi:hypothetical protein DIURU_005057 [Diutina rugosa]|uniref:Cyclic nucleotide-binding domain-containing protein n=1 Tax=Diutina rugosa TaxID=5481 RepID=A0A642UG32_DIURU|nr:uncharacterized protein DIURU_005057 [Diutina rugosa]KAA8898202.1 hypothetical protein DIURU_005057 [Diutina rugosa]
MKPARKPRFTPASPSPLSGSPSPHYGDDDNHDCTGSSVSSTFSIGSRRSLDHTYSPLTDDNYGTDDDFDDDRELYGDEVSEVNDDSQTEGSDFMIPPQFLARLRTFPLFNKAPKSFHSKIATNLKLVSFHPQQYIIRQGDASMSMYWILKGTVSVTSTDGEAVFAELAPGSFFGEIGILYNRPRTATVVARTRVLLGVLTSDALNGVLKNYPTIERRIRDEAQERLAMQEKKRKKDLQPYYPSGMDTNLAPVVANSIVAPVAKAPIASQIELTPGPSIPPQAGGSASTCLDSTISVKEFIMSLPIFAQLPSRIIHKIALMAEPLRAPAFDYIFRKGDKGSDIYFIISGEVEVIDNASTDKQEHDAPSHLNEKILARLGPGSYFGEISFLSLLNKRVDDTRSATIRAISTVDLIVVRTETLQQLCSQYPQLVKDMRRTAEERINKNKYHQGKNRLSIENLINRERLGTMDSRSSISQALAGSVAQLDAIPPKDCCDGLVSPPLCSPHSSRTNSPVQRIHSLSPKETSPFTGSGLFNAGWSFSNKATAASKSRSVSPITITHDSGPSSMSQVSSSTGSQARKRKSVYDVPATTLTLPPLNPLSPSLNTFDHDSPSRRGSLSSFQYMPHSKRLRLASVTQGRRRSSVLANPSPLPDRILLRVFELLDLPELMKLRQVSRRWRHLLHAAPNLCTHLDLGQWNTKIDDKAIISITDFVGGRAVCIDISNCFHMTDEGFSYLINEVGMSGRLTSLRMRSNWDLSAMAIMDLTAPSVGRYLEELDLSNCRKVRDNVVERLIGWDDPELARQGTIEDLDYAIDQIGCKNLKVLHLGYCKHLTDNVMLHIANHASKRLEMLDLTRCTTITDHGFQYWSYVSFPNLKKLSLKDCTFLTDKSIIALASSCQNLEILDLNFCCALTDVSIEVLAMGCQQLRELDMSFCGSAVSDSSLVTLSMSLDKLERLIVKGCIRITRAGVDALISGRAPLTFIDIRQCKHVNVYPEGVPAQTLNINPQTRSAFVKAGPYHNVIEIAL